MVLKKVLKGEASAYNTSVTGNSPLALKSMKPRIKPLIPTCSTRVSAE